jgi:hypothetical protein
LNVLKKILKNDLILSIIIFGELLVIVAAYFGINPAESSAVSSEIRGTTLHFFLGITCIPAIFLGLIPTIVFHHSEYVYAISILSIQAILYGFIGAFLAYFIKRKIFSLLILFMSSIGSGYFLFYISKKIMSNSAHFKHFHFELPYLVLTLIILVSSIYMMMRVARKKPI